MTVVSGIVFAQQGDVASIRVDRLDGGEGVASGAAAPVRFERYTMASSKTITAGTTQATLDAGSTPRIQSSAS